MSATQSIFVQSRLSSPSLSPSTFHKWYITVHIPDILGLPHVRSAFRYIAASTPEDELNTTGFPYLAIYPNLSTEWLSSPDCGFFKLPLHSEILPRGGPRENEKGGFVFDVADFEMGKFEVVKTVGEKGDEPGKYLIVVVVGEETVHGREGGVEGLLAESRGKLGLGAEGGLSTLLKGVARPEGVPATSSEVKEAELFVGKDYVILHQVDEKPTDLSEQWGEEPVLYNLMGGYGVVSSMLQ